MMTVQEHEDAPEEVIPRDQWSFSRLENGRTVPDAQHAYLEAGFQPGKVYQVIYTTTGAPVAGLGLPAIRDFASFCATVRRSWATPAPATSIARTPPASPRVADSCAYSSTWASTGTRKAAPCSTDSSPMWPAASGASSTSVLPSRLARLLAAPTACSPSATSTRPTPETGLTDGVLSRLTAQGGRPKIMYTYTPSEYWAGHGSLVHTDLTATRDVDVPEDVRIYVFAGSQHGPGTFPLTDGDPSDDIRSQNPLNCLDHRPFLRAALTNLDRWVTTGEAPPPSSHPPDRRRHRRAPRESRRNPQRDSWGKLSGALPSVYPPGFWAGPRSAYSDTSGYWSGVPPLGVGGGPGW